MFAILPVLLFASSAPRDPVAWPARLREDALGERYRWRAQRAFPQDICSGNRERHVWGVGTKGDCDAACGLSCLLRKWNGIAPVCHVISSIKTRLWVAWSWSVLVFGISTSGFVSQFTSLGFTWLHLA